jgi:hypothetical protein
MYGDLFFLLNHASAQITVYNPEIIIQSKFRILTKNNGTKKQDVFRFI